MLVIDCYFILHSCFYQLQFLQKSLGSSAVKSALRHKSKIWSIWTFKRFQLTKQVLFSRHETTVRFCQGWSFSFSVLVFVLAWNFICNEVWVPKCKSRLEMLFPMYFLITSVTTSILSWKVFSSASIFPVSRPKHSLSLFATPPRHITKWWQW